ncbi:MAG: ROK family protein [Armatimonadetes bacterium]|nr:ROK family protein [Armatimonadota bacterium]
MRTETLWGIDLGGTKIEGLVIESPHTSTASFGTIGPSEALVGTVLARLRLPTEAEQGYDHILERTAEMVALLEQETELTRPAKIGVGTPGSVRPDGTMKNCNTTCLNGSRLPEDLSTALGATAIVKNDADCFALAEALLGAGRGYGTVFGVIMGTGVGGGIVVDGALVSGPNGLTGEWGHSTLVPDGRECYCGRRGCVEQYLCGPAVERSHFERTGERMKLADIAATAECSEPSSARARECQETIERLCEDFGKALSTVVNVLDPDAIVLGGGAGQVSQLRTLGRDRLASNVFGPDFVTPLLSPELGDSAGVFGAALSTRSSALGDIRESD